MNILFNQKQMMKLKDSLEKFDVLIKKQKRIVNNKFNSKSARETDYQEGN